MVEAVFSFVASAAASALACQVVRAFPNWTRGNLTPPLAALEIASLAPAGNRIGQRSTRHALTLRLYVFAANESSLAQMLDDVLALKQSIASVEVVTGRRVNFAFTDGQRHINQTGTQQEDHGFSWGVTATYSETA